MRISCEISREKIVNAMAAFESNFCEKKQTQHKKGM